MYWDVAVLVRGGHASSAAHTALCISGGPKPSARPCLTTMLTPPPKFEAWRGLNVAIFQNVVSTGGIARWGER